jgi:flagellar biosynthesis/type III secretory pathway M-ring protein FliF/YscJ
VVNDVAVWVGIVSGALAILVTIFGVVRWFITRRERTKNAQADQADEESKMTQARMIAATHSPVTPPGRRIASEWNIEI